MNQEKYYFCYSTNLSVFLREDKGIEAICNAFHHKTKKRFWLFEKTDEVKEALAEYTGNNR
ncbi:hypothetical protein FKN04_12225 [Bacillus glycinifermentans]|uniref:hypothetical protein n=1 Tax=Bacillus glycinifermentans TaxID=1664069 RepID=UPI001583DE6C|nr:hypothetical protein [Bacillus glycinifermentans]NUJ17346.1 hypothetical protein [Bacillus glycinifermentans]